MAIESVGALRRYVFEELKDCRVTHGVFTRQGGVSPAPWASLNLGGGLGDDRENIIENRRRIFEAVGRRVESIYDVWQVHGIEVICTNQARPLDALHIKADAILTDRPEVTLFMRFADCAPIFLYDQQRGVVGLVHAGWKGTVNRIAAVAVAQMCARYGCREEDIWAGIGPAIGLDHYVVGTEVIEQVERCFEGKVDGLLVEQNGQVHFDLWQANRRVLMEAGVQHVQIAGICTACSLTDWYSHRAEHGKTGRFGALIALNN
jgi:YfiH family protein